jgi:Immunity protein Imm1
MAKKRSQPPAKRGSRSFRDDTEGSRESACRSGQTLWESGRHAVDSRRPFRAHCEQRPARRMPRPRCGVEMILEVWIHGEHRYVETWPAFAALNDEIVNNLAVENPDSPWVAPGEHAQLVIARERRPDPYGEPWPDNWLAVTVNATTGYGGLTWCRPASTAPQPTGDEIADYVWVIDNPSPPDFDPRVVSDPGVPYFYHPRSTLPVTLIRAALEEFCHTGTGDRPECVHWVHGHANGNPAGRGTQRRNAAEADVAGGPEVRARSSRNDSADRGRSVDLILVSARRRGPRSPRAVASRRLMQEDAR